jgi:hypothetical protein
MRKLGSEDAGKCGLERHGRREEEGEKSCGELNFVL